MFSHTLKSLIFLIFHLNHSLFGKFASDDDVDISFFKLFLSLHIDGGFETLNQTAKVDGPLKRALWQYTLSRAMICWPS